MSTLILGLALFLGVHSVSIAAPRLRDDLAARVGLGAWRLAYSAISAAGLGLMVWGYGLARSAPVLVYAPPAWTSHLAALLLVPVFPLLFAAYLPGRIRTAARHPMLASVKLWAAAHLVANGMLHDLVMFGAILAWAVADRMSFRWREQRPVPGAPPGAWNDALAVALGLATWALWVGGLHRWLIGLAPIPALSLV